MEVEMYGTSFHREGPDHLVGEPYKKLIVSETVERATRVVLSKTDVYTIPAVEKATTDAELHRRLLARWPHLGDDLIGAPADVQNMPDAELYVWLE